MSKKISNKHELLDKIVADYTKRTRDGAPPDIAQYKKKFPNLANEIEDLLSSVAMIEGLKREASANEEPSSEKNTGLANLKQLGDYVLIREVGRGGMGVVFEAIHQSLGRRVALKVMLENELENEKHIARFRREAQAAAKLHHTNIVSVFGVGESNGYHFYVMEYIDGISLKSAVDSMSNVHSDEQPTVSRVGSSADETAFDKQENQPHCETKNATLATGTELSRSNPPGIENAAQRYRWVGKIGAQVADALGYSHGLGILHRDIKPANLMMDNMGQVWITDFGLVKLSDEEGFTKTGAVLGTPRYLAPESLKGEYDQQSETYCLGLSLYELATLKPAFKQGTHAEVFSQIIHETPAAPSKVDPSIPRDLSTIIEKAISKDPRSRYPDAFALRDDLRAFLDDRPISARRPSAFEQVARWSRKNPLVASLGALSAALVMATAIVASSAWVVTSHAYGKLESQIEETNVAKRIAETNERTAVQNFVRAEENFNRAEANVNLMVKAFDELFTEYLQNQTTGDASFDFDGFDELAGIEISIDTDDASYLKKMAGFYEQFARGNSDNKELLSDAAKSWRRVANINYLIGEHANAISSYEKAVSCYSEILDQKPESVDALLDLVATRSEMSNAVRVGSRRMLERNSKPLMLIKSNIDLIDNHSQRDDRRVRFALAETLSSLASAEVVRLATESVFDWDQLVEESPKQKPQKKLRSYDQKVKQSVERAVKIAQELVELEPENLEYKVLLGKSKCSLGALEANFGNKSVAKDSLQFAVTQFQDLAKQFPDDTDYQYQSAIAMLLIPTELEDANAKSIKKNIESVQKAADSLVSRSPNPAYQQLKIVSRLKMAEWLIGNDQPKLAVEQLLNAADLLKASDLDGQAWRSMRNSIGFSFRRIAKGLPPEQRRDIFQGVRGKLNVRPQNLQKLKGRGVDYRGRPQRRNNQRGNVR